MRGPAFDDEALRAALAGPRRGRAATIGRRVEYHARITSTNDRARELAASGEPEGTVVVADEQTRGRGRASRTWHSPPGLGLYLSVILRPEAPPEGAPLFGLLASVAVAAALERFSPCRVGIKWPNDLVLAPPEAAGRRLKIGGILTEARTSPDAIRDLIIGVGINVNQETGDFPTPIAGLATSLRLIRGEPADRVALACEILTALDGWYTLWSEQGEDTVLRSYEATALDLHGHRVRITGGACAWTGTTAGITREGALRVEPDEAGRQGESGPIAIRYGEVLRIEEV